MTDKCLPSAVESERLVLGFALAYPEVLHDIRPLLSQDDFSTTDYQRLWIVITELYDSATSVDRVTVYEAMQRRKWPMTLSQLIEMDEGMPRLPSIGEYVQTVKDKALLRRIVHACRSIAGRAMDPAESPQAVLEAFARIGVDLAPKDETGGLQSAGELIDEVGLGNLLAPRKDRGLMFPWPWLSRWTSGMLPSELWVLAGHTSTGKTSAALQHAVEAARRGAGVAIFSLEVAKQSLFAKACYQLARVDSEKLKQGFPMTGGESAALRRAANELHKLPIYFDTQSTTVPAIHAAVRRRRLKSPIDHVVIDYLQLLGNSGRHDNRAQAVGANAWSCKMLATDFQVPVLLLSQLSRQEKGVRPRRPELSDLKESGDIENHANGVIFLHRESQEDADAISIDFMLAKQRDGRRNIMNDFWFFPKSQRFEEKERG